ncbi:hypothetical protein [Pedobacter panaciterrae]
MKRKFYLMMLVVLGTAIGLMYACKKSDGREPDEKPVGSLNNPIPLLEAGGPYVSNGWLRFPTLKSFENTMSHLHGKYQNPGELGKWEVLYNRGGFTSLRKFYEQIDADTSENRKAPTVDSLFKTKQLFICPDSWFATVLNKNGFIQVADTVYSFRTGQKSQEGYAVPAKYATELVRGAKPLTLPGAKMHRISFDFLEFPQWQWPDDWHVPQPSDPIVIPNFPICQYPSGNMPNWWGQSGGDIYRGNDGTPFPEHNGRQVKLNYHRWRVGYIFYASAGIRVKMLKHTRFAGWQSVTYADEMVMDACCKGNVFIPGLPLIPFNEQVSPGWPNFARYAENNFEKTMKWTASGVFNEIILQHFNFHFRVNYRGRIAERYIRQ